MAWYGGCHFRPSKLFEEYMNHPNNFQYPPPPGVTSDFRNKRISGTFVY